ncbi:AEC family transporter [Paracoccus thiocyanatus]|uniref:Permease n=1 Tax=Paracoccus thiocyanatus TaxID=34006 RepID=A0A3D8P8Y6_9RHOB|nr:AEC family transporter [Paracoccus thiocyanatus]RDW11907.1 permease [Paracoccus thiocyanatus]
MLGILSVTGVAFVLIVLGYVAVRLSVLSELDMSALGRFVISFALPALIFRAMAERDLGEIFDIGYLAAYLAGSLWVFAAGYWWSRQMSRLTPIESTFQGMGMCCANSGFIGYPILLMALPKVASTALTLALIVENLFLIPLMLVMAERAERATERGRKIARQIAAKLLRNPIIGAIMVGLFVSLFQLEVPPVIAKSVDLLALSSTAIALVVIGGTLPKLSLQAPHPRVVPVVVGKLILHPLAVGLGLVVTTVAGFSVVDPQLADAAIIIAAMPTMGIYPILAQRYGQQQGAALAMLVMTVLSFFSISLVLHLLVGNSVG